MKSINYLLHGFILAFGSAIIIYVFKLGVNIYISPRELIPPTIFTITIYFIFILIIYLLSHDLNIAGLITSILILGFFYIWKIFLVIVLSISLTYLVLKKLRKNIGFNDLHLIANVISLTVIGYFVFQLIGTISTESWASYPDIIQPIENIPDELSIQLIKPDIYYLILDGYGREDMLQAVHDFDNSEFVSALRSRGFLVVPKSEANYERTLLSLASSLNLQYLDTMSSVMGDSYLWWPVTNEIKHSDVRNILQRWGYKTVFFASDWDFTDIHDGDFYEAPFPIMLNNFEDSFLYLTNLRYFQGLDHLGIDFPSYDSHRRIILFDFMRLPEVSSIQGPKFVFAHIIAPHPPYVFDNMGNPLSPDELFSLHPPSNSDIEQSRKSYLNQLEFINTQVLKTIDGILAESATPPIIIIQGDHGPDIFVDHFSLENTCIYERYSILNAYYLPNINPNLVPSDLSPVNSFRFVFNYYFRLDLNLLPNQQFYSTEDRIYDFINITNQPRDLCQ